MKTPSPSSPAAHSDLKVLAIVGAVVVVAMFVAPILLGYIVFMRSATQTGTVNNNVVLREDEPLGEKGSRCGSNAHLPCRPGLVCTVSAPAVGVCVEGVDSVTAYPQLEAECGVGEAPSCAPGLVCEFKGGLRGFCKPSTTISPHVVSVQLEGPQPVPGGYSGMVGDEVTVNVQTVNAKTLSVKLVSTEKKVILTATESDGGVWKVTFKMPNTESDLVVTAVADDGRDRSSLVVHVAPTP